MIETVCLNNELSEWCLNHMYTKTQSWDTVTLIKTDSVHDLNEFEEPVYSWSQWVISDIETLENAYKKRINELQELYDEAIEVNADVVQKNRDCIKACNSS